MFSFVHYFKENHGLSEPYLIFFYSASTSFVFLFFSFFILGCHLTLFLFITSLTMIYIHLILERSLKVLLLCPSLVLFGLGRVKKVFYLFDRLDIYFASFFSSQI